MSSTSLSEALMERKLRAIFRSKDFDMETETFKSIRSKLCQSLSLEEFPSDQKAILKDLIKRLVNEEEDDSEDEEEQVESSEDNEKEEPPRPKKKRKAPSTNQNTTKPVLTQTNKQVQTLLELGKALRLGPRLYRGLKDLEDDRERISVLKERLQAAGASWDGKLPTQVDIQRAKKKRQRLDDLDGMDPSLILEGGRRRRGTNHPPPRPAGTSQSDSDDDDKDSEDDFDQDDQESEEEEFE